MPAKKAIGADQVAQALRKTHGNMSAAARMLGVERNTIRHYMVNYPTVRAAHDEAASVVSDIAEGHLVKDVMSGKWDQVKYWLESKARERGYGKPAASGLNVTMTAAELAAMEDGDLDKLIAQLSKLNG